jgi:hypothetical protein
MGTVRWAHRRASVEPSGTSRGLRGDARAACAASGVELLASLSLAGAEAWPASSAETTKAFAPPAGGVRAACRDDWP